MFKTWKHRIWLAGLLSLGLAIALLGTTPAIVASQTPSGSGTELRGVWLTNIDSDVLFSQRNLRRGLQRLQRLNFNTIYPTVWNWGYTLYPSAVAENVIGQALDPEPGLQGRDMLAEAVEYGHARGLAVIPWFEFGFMAPADSALARRHPDWITNRADGSQIVLEGKHERVWLNPFHPQVQQFITVAIAEIVTNYNIDGIQFDDHLGLPVELGYDAYTVGRYQQEHRGQKPSTDPRDPEWVRWRADKITEVMTHIFHTVKALKPECLVSVAPNPQEFAYNEFLQDWQAWRERGLIEELIVQVYRDRLESFRTELNAPSLQAAQNHIPVSIGILTGLKNRPVETELIQDQVQAARRAGFSGVSFFFYESLGARDPVFRQLFPTPAKRPGTLLAHPLR